MNGSVLANTTSVLPERRFVENVEIAYLSVIVVAAVILNTIVFIQLLRSSKTPTARTSFLAGPYHLTSFTLFKLNLCVTDFIILAHATGKIIWLTTYDWRFGAMTCKSYTFLSALAYYANSNVIVAIGLDRLKVVYTSHVQGATSMRRVQHLLLSAWILALLCAIPQLFVWGLMVFESGEVQCVAFPHGSPGWWSTLNITYEIFHQAAVFWIPFTLIFVSYLLIVVRLLHYTLSPKKVMRPGKSSHSEISGRAPMVYKPLKIFVTALAVVAAHCMMWLPYNLLSSLRFLNETRYEAYMSHGGALVEDLIIANSLLNPLLYAYNCR